MTGKRALWLMIMIALLAIAFYLWGPDHTPSGQLPLESLGQRNLVDFQQSFNAAAAYTRIVLLLSPT